MFKPYGGAKYRLYTEKPLTEKQMESLLKKRDKELKPKKKTRRQIEDEETDRELGIYPEGRILSRKPSFNVSNILAHGMYGCGPNAKQFETLNEAEKDPIYKQIKKDLARSQQIWEEREEDDVPVIEQPIERRQSIVQPIVQKPKGKLRFFYDLEGKPLADPKLQGIFTKYFNEHGYLSDNGKRYAEIVGGSILSTLGDIALPPIGLAKLFHGKGGGGKNKSYRNG